MSQQGFLGRVNKLNQPKTPPPKKNSTSKKTSKKSSKSKSKTNVEKLLIVLKTKQQALIDEFEHVKGYLRKGNRPNQKGAIELFEKHLGGLLEIDEE